MSRSGYVEDFDCDDDLAHGRYRGQVASATRGKRGQTFFKDALDALYAIPVKELEAKSLRTEDGGFCTIGAMLKHREIDMSEFYDDDDDQCDHLSGKLDVAHQLVREVIWANDEHPLYSWGQMHYEWRIELGKSVYTAAFGETKAERWFRMRDWLKSKIIEAA